MTTATHDPWVDVISNILAATALAIDRLDTTTRDALTRALHYEAADYADADDLARRARAALNHLDRIN